VGSDDGVVYAISPQDGAIRWSYKGKGAVSSHLAAEADTVYFTSAANRVVALDAANGERRWQYERERPEGFSIHGHSGPRLGGDVLFVGFDDGFLVALGAKSGDLRWAHSLAAASDLQGSFPELHFIDGLIGYHLLRRPGPAALAGPGAGAAAGDRRTLQATLDSFDRYLAATQGRAESEARALARVLQGNAVLHAAPQPWPTPQLQAAERHYLAARELAPTSTVASTFALACGSALCARGACSLEPDRLHEGFVEAVGRDPSSRELVGNLEQFYAAAERGSLKVTMPADELARQRELTKSVRAGMN